MRAVGMQVKAIVMAPPSRAHAVGFLDDSYSKPLCLEARRTSKPSWPCTNDHRIRAFRAGVARRFVNAG